MYQAIEAVSKAGHIQVLEPVDFDENEQLIILRLSKHWQESTSSKTTDWRKFAGILKDSTALEGDPVAIQRAMRDEWR